MSLILHSGYGYSKRLCENIITFFLESFYPRHNVKIHVLHRGLRREGVYGYCDLDGETKRNPRDFLIEIQTHLPEELYTKVLFHELTHVSQWIDGKLKYKRGKLCYNSIPMDDLDYEDQFHEIEAKKSESILYDLYTKF
jgi:hypothetical protein